MSGGVFGLKKPNWLKSKKELEREFKETNQKKPVEERYKYNPRSITKRKFNALHRAASADEEYQKYLKNENNAREKQARNALHKREAEYQERLREAARREQESRDSISAAYQREVEERSGKHGVNAQIKVLEKDIREREKKIREFRPHVRDFNNIGEIRRLEGYTKEDRKKIEELKAQMEKEGEEKENENREQDGGKRAQIRKTRKTRRLRRRT